MRQETTEIAAITADTASPTFDNTIVPLEKSGQMLDRVQAVFGLLTQANTNDTLQRLATLQIALTRPPRFTPLSFPLRADRLQTQTLSTETWRERVQREAQRLERLAS